MMVKASPTLLSAPGAADAVDVILRMMRHVEIDHVADLLDVDAARGNIGGDHHFVAAVAKSVRAPSRSRWVRLECSTATAWPC